MFCDKYINNYFYIIIKKLIYVFQKNNIYLTYFSKKISNLSLVISRGEHRPGWVGLA